jgi:hypothetical protein
VLYAGTVVAVLLTSPVLFLATHVVEPKWLESKWAVIVLNFSFPGLLAATMIGPFAGGGVHSGRPIIFIIAVFILNIAIFLTALHYILKLIERFTKWRKEQG